jgi:hypothetical protein
MQHDCSATHSCSSTNVVYEVQEREETTRHQYRVKHSNTVHFIINLHALHNAQRIRCALPSNLYSRCPQTIDKQEVFRLAVEKMKHMKEEKDKVATAKREARAVIAGVLGTSESVMNNPSESSSQPATQRPKRRVAGNDSAGATRASKRPRYVEPYFLDIQMLINGNF